ncbi:MAG: hypothetical protein RJA36_1460 [Pseudomonadota bacterium]|jgi:hypothetical protein
MATFVKFQAFVEAVAEKKHNLGADTLKYYLTNTAPDVAADAVKADLPAEISAGNGYSAGGFAVTITSSAQTSGTYKLVLADATLTASGGSIGPFRYVVLYNDTSANDDLIAYWDYGSSITINDTETFTVDADPTNGILTFA